MTKANQIAVVETRIEERHGCFYLSSPDMPELHLCGKDPKKLNADVPAMIKVLYQLNFGLDVEVKPAARPNLKPARPATSKTEHRRFLAYPQMAAA